MSKYDPLWAYLSSFEPGSVTLTFADAESVLGFPIDHSFLTFKKELEGYGWKVLRISLKNKAIDFRKI